MDMEIDRDNCINCGKCVEICPVNVFELKKGEPVIENVDDCTLCGVCADQCPEDAIEVQMDKDASSYRIDFEAEQDYVDWSNSLQKILDLEKNPVAIKLVSDPSEVPEEVKEFDFPVRHCVSINMGTLGATFYLPDEQHACAAAKAALGISELPERVKSGKVPYMHGLASSQGAAARIMEEIPKLSKGKHVGTLVSPLEKTPFDPDVIILMARPEQAMWVANSMIFDDGGPRITANFAGMQASCGDVTVLPYRENEVNFSLGCYGCRSAGKLGKDEMYVGIPREKVQGIVSGLDGLRKAMKQLRKGE